ncbi:sodium/glucose cotransporter 4-like isoform X3 [Amblyomma americanum]
MNLHVVDAAAAAVSRRERASSLARVPGFLPSAAEMMASTEPPAPGAHSHLGATLHGADVAVVVVYLASVLGVGLWASIRGRHDSTSDYFLGGRSMHWILVGASLFASNVGTDHFVGLAGSGAATGIGVAGFELNALFIVLLLAWVFVPVYLASGVFTMPEYLRKRFGGQRIRIYLSVLALLSYVFTKISVAYRPCCGSTSSKPSSWWPVHLCLLCWVIVQRSLSAKNLSHAKAGSILTGYLKILPLFVMVFPGMAARVLYPEVIGCSDPELCRSYCGNERGCTNIAYPLLVLRLMPAGGRGLMMSVMTASLVANLASIFNSASTLFTMDLWNSMRRQKASEQELVIVGRCFLVLLVVVSILWIPVIEVSSGSQLFDYIQSVSSFLAPPVCAVYVLALGWSRINEQGAFWGLMTGLAAGLGRFAWEYSYALPPCGFPDPRPEAITRIHYLHYGCLLFILTAGVCTIVSLLTEPIPEDSLYRLTFWTVDSTEPRVDLDEPPHSKDETLPTHNPPPAAAVDGGQKKTSFFKLLLWACRATKSSGEPPARLTPVEEVARAAEAVRENDVPRRLCIINGLVLLVVAGLINGYYA